jgi:hypothetical protein
MTPRERPSSTRDTLARIAATTLLALALGALGFVLLATRFMIYDDEGYVLWSVRDVCEGRALYSEVFSQYGPLFYLGYRVLHALSGINFDNETGRLLTLVYWLCTAGVCGWIARGLTRSWFAGAVAATLTFLALISNINEPFHPGSLLAALSALAAALGVRAVLRDREDLLPWLIAPLGAAMALIKLNVGVFVLAALGTWMLLGTRASPRVARFLPIFLAPLLAAAPFTLMLRHLGESWALFQAVCFAGGALALLVLHTREKRDGAFGARGWAAAIALPLGVFAAVAICMRALGTSWSALLEGVLVAPFRHPGIYVVPSDFAPHHAVFATVMLVASVIATRTRFQVGKIGLDLLAVGKLLVGVWLGWKTSDLIYNYSLDREIFLYGSALLPLLVHPLAADAPDRTARALRWTGLVLVWQTLQSYPVAGSQIAWGGFLFMPLAVIAWFDAARYLSARFEAGRCLPVLLRILAATTGLIGVFQAAFYARECWTVSERLDVPGARWLRPPPPLASSLRATHRNLERHADEVFSFPGMFSFNIWTGLPSPTHRNVTHWFSLLGEEEQQAIIRRIEGNPRSLVVVQREHVHFLMRTGFPPQGPLKDFILRRLGPLLRVGSYDIWGARDRAFEPVEVFTQRGSRVVVCLPAPPRPVASARLMAPNEATLFVSVPDGGAPDPDGYLRLELALRAPRVATARLELLDAEGTVLARLPPNLSPLTAASPPAAD